MVGESAKEDSLFFFNIKKYWSKISAGLVLLILSWLFTFGVINFETFIKAIAALSTMILIIKNA
jgi:hypothetical protein